jgi:hypothetical protein
LHGRCTTWTLAAEVPVAVLASRSGCLPLLVNPHCASWRTAVVATPCRVAQVRTLPFVLVAPLPTSEVAPAGAGVFDAAIID